MTAIALERKPDYRKFALAALIALAFFLLGLFASRITVPAATPVPVVPCRQCSSCSCPRLAGATMCGCPR